MATDVDGDGIVEILSFQELRLHRITRALLARDISDSVFPRGVVRRGAVAVAELDFDNDGKFDLYIARATTGNLRWLRTSYHGDYLLRNVGGRYVDVSQSAGLPRFTQSRGVTAGDFNNDGFVDLLVTQFVLADYILFNNGDGTFTKRFSNLRRPRDIRGDGPTAVDLDRDGNLDLVLSEGDWISGAHRGFYRVMRNIANRKGWLLVRVRNSPLGNASSLHAVVKVFIPGRGVMMRRVGSPGTAVSNSLLEVVHIGIGADDVVRKILVEWTDGGKQARYGVKADSQVTFGK